MFSRANCFLPASRYRPKMETKIVFESFWMRWRSTETGSNQSGFETKRLQLFEVWRILFFFLRSVAFFVTITFLVLAGWLCATRPPNWAIAFGWLRAKAEWWSIWWIIAMIVANRWHTIVEIIRFPNNDYRNVFLLKILNETTVFKA